MWRCQAAREDAEIPRLELEHDRARHAFGLACGGPGLFRKAADVRCQHRQWQILGEGVLGGHGLGRPVRQHAVRSDEHTSELQSLMRTSSAVLCLQKTKPIKTATNES